MAEHKVGMIGLRREGEEIIFLLACSEEGLGRFIAGLVEGKGLQWLRGRGATLTDAQYADLERRFPPQELVNQGTNPLLDLLFQATAGDVGNPDFDPEDETGDGALSSDAVS